MCVRDTTTDKKIFTFLLSVILKEQMKIILWRNPPRGPRFKEGEWKMYWGGFPIRLQVLRVKLIFYIFTFSFSNDIKQKLMPQP